MKNLRLLTSTKPENLYIDVVKNKHGNCGKILKAATPATAGISKQRIIFNQFQMYRKERKSLENLNPIFFSSIEVDCLLGCYSSKTKGLDALVEQIRGMLDVHSQAHCPYCGIDSIQTFDHYLPQSDFPEFSVLSYNLIPCCYDCNNIKSDNWVITGKRLFIHYYFDPIPDEIFLIAKVTMLHGAPNVSFSLKPPNGNPIYDIIHSHYQELNLIEKILEKCNSHLVNAYNNNQMALREGLNIDEIKRNIKRNIKVKEASYGKNHWEVVIDRGILKCPHYFL
jgi:hypothetical protein